MPPRSAPLPGPALVTKNVMFGACGICWALATVPSDMSAVAARMDKCSLVVMEAPPFDDAGSYRSPATVPNTIPLRWLLWLEVHAGKARIGCVLTLGFFTKAARRRGAKLSFARVFPVRARIYCSTAYSRHMIISPDSSEHKDRAGRKSWSERIGAACGGVRARPRAWALPYWR